MPIISYLAFSASFCWNRRVMRCESYGVKRLVTQLITPVKFSRPSKISISATQNSIDRPRRGGITTPKIIIADPTKKMVNVWPRSPEQADGRRASDRTLTAHDCGYCDDVVGVGGVAHSKE